MFDLNKTIELIKGGLLEPRATWQSYLTENRNWQDTATLLTAPLILASLVLTGLLSLLFRSYHMFGARPGFGGWLLGLVAAFVGIAVAAFIFSYLAGLFKGRHDFDRGLAAVSLAAIPAYVGSVLGTVPFIGWLISLALGIVTLVFLYQIIPSYLEVPEDKRILHYVASLIATFVVMMIIGALLGLGGARTMHHEMSMTDQPSQPGMLGDVQRYADLMDKAEQDRYDPPGDGRISDGQMTEFMTVMRKTADIRQERMARIEELSKEYENKEPDAGDIAAMSSGIGSVLGAVSAEMEVVMTGQGNWAEHQWVKEQLRVARIQKDINEAVKHNYSLYQAHQGELKKLAAFP